MEQKPVAGVAPLVRPDADVARAYLAEAEMVAQRREMHIDRRRMARLQMIEGAVLAVYLTLMMFGFGEPSAGARFIVLVPLLLLWIQLSAELRSTYGFQQRRTMRDNLPLLLVAGVGVLAMFAGVVLQISGVELSLIVRLAPGLLILIGFGSRALVDHWRARALPPVTHTPAEFTKGARVATAVLGLLLGGSVVAAAADALFASALAMLVIMAMTGWFIAAQITARVPALGAMWRWPQWTAFTVGAGTVAWSIVPARHAFDLGGGLAAGAGIVLIFTIAALWGARSVD